MAITYTRRDRSKNPVRLREGDIESIRRNRVQEGRPLKSDMVRDGAGDLTHYKIDNGRVKVISSDKDNQ